jgi:hypothetical protein
VTDYKLWEWDTRCDLSMEDRKEDVGLERFGGKKRR